MPRRERNKFVKKNQVLELRIEDYAFGGKGIARIRSDEGIFVVFVPNTLPGQLVKAQVSKSSKNYAECKLIDVLEPSENEIKVPYQDIPGAPYIQLPIELQHQYKKESTLSLFKRIGKVENIEDLFDEFVTSPNVFHYRNKMEYGFSAIGYDRITKRDKDEFTLGFKRRGVWWMGDNLEKDSGLFDKQMEDHLKNIREYCIETGLAPWHGPKREGFFRYFVVRKSFKTNQLLELDYDKDFPITRGYPKNIVGYMSGDQSRIAPIMSKGDNVYSFGNNAYGKPATALWILRETIMGKELFDYAFKTYAQRWMFKHPSPADFFRTMEDASGVDLDWFWRGWFYSTDVTDIGIEGVRKFYAKESGNETIAFVEDKSAGLKIEKPKNATAKYFYEITFNKPGGLVMPIIVEYTYDDGTTKKKTYPAQIWRYNDKKVTKVVHSEKQILKIVIDPDLETADVNTSNNSFPAEKINQFNTFKTKVLN